MFLGGRWQDITSDVLVPSRIKITKGRGNGSTEDAPMVASFSLRNEDLQWSQGNPLGPYYGDLQRNVPVAIEHVLAADDFDRTSPAGLGSAPTGQTWATSGAGGAVSDTDTSISGGMARFSVPAVSAHRLAYLVGPSQYNQSVECAFQLPFSNVTGGDLEPANLLLRMTSTTTYYMIRVVITAAEAVTVAIIAKVNGVDTTIASAVTVAGLTHTGQRLRVKAAVEGQTIRAKVWDESLGEPLDYQVTGRDAQITAPGTCGVRNGVAAANTNALPVVFGIDDFTMYSPRFRGELSTIVLSDNEKGTNRQARCTAAGLLRRLGQGTSPVMSSLKRGYLGIGPTLINYWPCEDGNAATSIASALGRAPMHLVGSPDFAVNDDFPCSQRLPSLNNSAWFGDVPDYTFTGEIQCRFLVSIPSSSPPPNETVLIRLFGAGTIKVWEVLYLTGGQMKVKAFNVNDVEVYDSGALGFTLNDSPSRISFEITNNGANVDWDLSSLRVSDTAGGGVSGTVAGFNCGKVTQVMAGPQGLADTLTLGHISLESAITNIFANVSELIAWFNEDVVARTRRLCAENEISFSHYEGAIQDGSLMGYQRPLRLVELLHESESTDLAILHEPRSSFGLELRTRRSLYAQSARLTADVSRKQVGYPFRPTADDQLTRNDVTVEQPDGSSARAELTTGPLSTQDYPDGIGRVDTTDPVNISRASLLPNHAEWRLAIGTTTAPRTPDVKMPLDAAEIAALKSGVLDLMLGDRIVYSNAGEKTGYYDPVAQLLRGITEEWTNHEAVFFLNGVPEGPYAVGAVDADARLDSGSSTLSGALSASATGTFSVATSNTGDLWITTATHQPDAFGTNHFPVDVMIGGERITISSITGATSPQTFTIGSRGVNGVKEPGAVGKAHASGAEVHAADPFTLGL